MMGTLQLYLKEVRVRKKATKLVEGWLLCELNEGVRKARDCLFIKKKKKIN